MPLSPYFLQGSSSEQRLVQDLINEQLKIYGQDIVYLPRKIINKKTIMKEVVASTFDDAYRMEAYLLNYQGFEGNGDILQKFGVQTTDAVTFVVSKERYEESPEIMLQEGDLLFTKDGTIGKTLYIESLPKPTSLNSHLLVIRPLNKFYDSKFLQYMFKTSQFLMYVEHNKTGTTFYGMSQNSMENFVGFSFSS